MWSDIDEQTVYKIKHSLDFLNELHQGEIQNNYIDNRYMICFSMNKAFVIEAANLLTPFTLKHYFWVIYV